MRSPGAARVTRAGARVVFHAPRAAMGSERAGQMAAALSARRCKFKTVETHVEGAWFQRLKQTIDEPLSSFAFNINLGPYRWAECALDNFQRVNVLSEVGRCRSTPGRPQG